MTPITEALRQRATARCQVCLNRLAEGFTSCAKNLTWLECPREEVWAPVAATSFSSYFVAEGGLLMAVHELWD